MNGIHRYEGENSTCRTGCQPVALKNRLATCSTNNWLFSGQAKKLGVLVVLDGLSQKKSHPPAHQDGWLLGNLWAR
jgi:hypothetical protein